MKQKVMLIALLVLMAGLLSAQNMYGAFQIITEPYGASITLYGTNYYLGTTPTQAMPIIMDQYMTYNYGTPGRVVDIVVSKLGFVSLRQQIFVPYNRKWESSAVKNPTVFYFALQPVAQPPYWGYNPPPYYYYYLDPPFDQNYNSGHGNGHGHGNGNNQCGPGHKPPSGGNNNQGGHGNGGGHGGHAGKPRP